MSEAVKHRRSRRERTLAEMKEKGYVCPKEAADMAHVAQSTIYVWMNSGELSDIVTIGLRAKFIAIKNLRAVAGLVEPATTAA